MWVPWYERVRQWFLKVFVICPCCNGDGGETEGVLDDGTGPYYPCNYCHETGVVLNPWKHLLWWYWAKDAKKTKKKSLLDRLR